MCCWNACLAKFSKVCKMLKSSLSPNMKDIEQIKLYKDNLTKAWIASMCSQGYRIIVALFGFAQWQKDLKKADEAQKDGTAVYNLDMFN